MIVFKDIKTLTDKITELKRMGKTIGFVPTMGALHQGHLSLVKLSNEQTDITVASIFVNPTQFNDPNDFEKYPITIENDISLLEMSDCDILFLPSISVIYPEGTLSEIHYDLGELENLLEGKHRPGHFQGVAQVVHRLLSIVEPDILFLGSKDYQQCMVIKRLVEIIQAPVKIVKGDTFREPSGLAMSSRNTRLTEEQRKRATAIYDTLQYIKEHYTTSDFQELEQKAIEMLQKNGFEKVDYVAIADANSLNPAKEGQHDQLVALVAAFMGDVRLIDNMVLTH